MGFLMRVSILPWGNPKDWKYVKYSFGSTCVEGFSTLSLITSSPDLRPDLVLIYVLDTLSEDVRDKDYRSLVSDARNLVEKYLCVDDNSKIMVKVLPGIMRRWKGDLEILFKGDPGDIRLKLSYHTYCEVVENIEKVDLQSENDLLEILLDTTHGVNYFTILVREAIFEASSMLAVHGKKVRVKVFNSDPLSMDDLLKRSESEPCRPKADTRTIAVGRIPTTEYNLLYEVDVRPWDLTRYLRYSGGSVKKLLSDIRSCNLDQNYLNDLATFSKNVVASYRVGALVELLTLTKERPNAVEELARVIKSALECWYAEAKIEKSDGNKYETKFTKLRDGLRLFLHTHSILSGVKKLINLQSPLTLREVMNARKRLLEGSEITNALVDSEIGIIKKLAKEDKIPEDWKTYAEILKDREGYADIEDLESLKSSQERMKRNFIAHAGFLKDFLELRKGGDVELRIREECREAVNKILGDIFRELTY